MSQGGETMTNKQQIARKKEKNLRTREQTMLHKTIL